VCQTSQTVRMTVLRPKQQRCPQLLSTFAPLWHYNTTGAHLETQPARTCRARSRHCCRHCCRDNPVIKLMAPFSSWHNPPGSSARTARCLHHNYSSRTLLLACRKACRSSLRATAAAAAATIACMAAPPAADAASGKQRRPQRVQQVCTTSSLHAAYTHCC
jgi:hypothetical protein